jgi:hypothetical protein
MDPTLAVLESVSENVITTYTTRSRLPDWNDRYWSQGATFKMQGNKKFVAVIDEIMHAPFRVGSDGTTCWFLGPATRIEIPSQAVEEKNVLLVDPFDARGAADVASIIRGRKLDYSGEVDLNGRRCHLIRSWDITLPSALIVILGPRWYYDGSMAHESDGARIVRVRTAVPPPCPGIGDADKVAQPVCRPPIGPGRATVRLSGGGLSGSVGGPV